MKLAAYNVEWMNALFIDTQLDLTDKPSSREDVSCKTQLTALANVFKALDADGIMIIEAPNEYEPGATCRALENFAAHFKLRQSAAIFGAPSDTDQEIAFLYDPRKIAARYTPHKGPNPPKFTDEYCVEIDQGFAEPYRFSKPPLELEIYDKISMKSCQLIGAHLKSKAPHGAQNDAEARIIGLENRRKQIAQAKWLRKRILQIDEALVVMGDFNDGPGLDALESEIGQSSVDILTNGGVLYDPSLASHEKWSARFVSHGDHKILDALIDFAFVNPEMRPFAKDWEIWHPLQNARINQIPELREALLTASDHFPLSLSIDWDTRK